MRALALKAGLLRPGEVHDLDVNEGVGLVLNTGVGVVPGEEGSEETKDTTGLLQSEVAGSSHATRVEEVRQGQAEEGDVEGEEEGEEGNGRAHGAEEEDKGEDEPAHEVEAESVVKCSTVTTVSLLDLEEGSLDAGPRDPETTVRRESSSRESVARSHFPHASEKLNLIVVRITVQ